MFLVDCYGFASCIYFRRAQALPISRIVLPRGARRKMHLLAAFESQHEACRLLVGQVPTIEVPDVATRGFQGALTRALGTAMTARQRPERFERRNGSYVEIGVLDSNDAIRRLIRACSAESIRVMGRPTFSGPGTRTFDACVGTPRACNSREAPSAWASSSRLAR